MKEWESYFWEWDLWQQEFVLIHSRPSPAYLATCVKSSSRKNWPAVFFTCFPFPFIHAHICFCARVTSASRIFLSARSWFFFLKKILSRISFSHQCFNKAHSISAVKWLDVSVLLPKNASVFDCAPTGMPHLQGLASYPCLLGLFFCLLFFGGIWSLCIALYHLWGRVVLPQPGDLCWSYWDFCVNGANSTERTLSQTDVIGKSRQRVCRSSYFI